VKRGYRRKIVNSFLATMCLASIIALTGCSGFLASSGPNRKEVLEAPSASPAAAGIQLVEINRAVACKLLDGQKHGLFSELFPDPKEMDYVVGPGDYVEVSMWEAPPGTLFGSIAIENVGSTSSRGTVIPDQMVSSDGFITVPFVGRLRASGRTLHQIEAAIAKKLGGVAHQPQVLVRLSRNTSNVVTVVGEVSASVRVPLTPGKERLLDALAAAGGARQPVSKVMLQVTRGNNVHSMPLETIIRDPKQNIVLDRGDVITALHQPYSFTVLGAGGKNEEISFEAIGISLVQALGRAGGLQDSRADAKGVFIFRLEPADCLDWPTRPVMATPSGKVPVIYRADLKDPAVFFAAQEFPIKDKDLLYISNASAAELQKFLNIVFSVVYPTLNMINIIGL